MCNYSFERKMHWVSINEYQVWSGLFIIIIIFKLFWIFTHPWKQGSIFSKLLLTSKCLSSIFMLQPLLGHLTINERISRLAKLSGKSWFSSRISLSTGHLWPASLQCRKTRKDILILSTYFQALNLKYFYTSKTLVAK